jgi:hypothetical protein
VNFIKPAPVAFPGRFFEEIGCRFHYYRRLFNRCRNPLISGDAIFFGQAVRRVLDRDRRS